MLCCAGQPNGQRAWGSRLVSIAKIAERTGLSKATVSRALRDLPSVADGTKATVRSAADELGYVPSAAASGLATGRNLAIGVLVPVLGRWFYDRVIEGADAELRGRGYDLILYNLGGARTERDRVFHRSILRRRIDALLVLALTFNPEEREQLLQTEYPTIAVGGPTQGVRHIGIDDQQAAYLATAHLIELGHRRIAHIGGDDPEGLNTAVPHGRLGGFSHAMREAGLAPRLDWVTDGTYTFGGGYERTLELFAREHDRPTAIFAASDEMAFGALTALARLGLRAPDDVSVIGIDGHDYGQYYGLTTLAQFPREQGRVAARQLLAELDGRPRADGFDPAPFEFVQRGSTGPVRG